MPKDDTPSKLTTLTPELDDATPDLFGVEVDQPSFLHAVLCQVGLPRAKVDGRTFVRTSGKASMLLEGGHWRDLWGKWVEAPLPYGTKPRLLMFHICSEVVRRKRPEVDLGGSVRKFLDRIGLEVGGNQWRMFKEQSRALAAMHMSLAYETADKLVNIKTDPIKRFDAWLYGDNLNSQGQLWPDELVVSDEFMRTLLDHAVPLDPEAIHKLQGSALALDVYTWLSHRLCRVRKDGGLPLYWFSLRGQFGQEYRSDKDFKREFLKALTAVKAAYPDARVDQVKGGIRLYPSPPPVKRSQVVVPLAPPAPPVLRPDQIHLKPETMDQVRDVAPGWDKYHLEGLWRDWIATKAGMPNDPDKAFLGWCRKFTKGKRPS
jgi:hypothetical protein